MKSFVAYPLDFETLLFPPKNEKNKSGKLVAHYELLKKVSHLSGSIVKCGITASEGFTRFATLREMIGKNNEQKMIAFEKYQPIFHEEKTADGEVLLKVKNALEEGSLQQGLIDQASFENIEYVPGLVSETIPQYIMDNPELKIAMLNIDLDEYDATITTLEFLFPRLMPGGILILDNFYKHLGEQTAVKDYFAPTKVTIHNFSVNMGPHYLVKP